MSKFKIFRIDHHDPAKVGRKTRRMYSLYTILAFIIIIILNIKNTSGHKPILILTIFLIVLILIYIFLIIKLKLETRKIRTIGDIEFTTSLIKKRIGDTLTEYNYHIISELEIQKHIPATSEKDTKSGYFSYILKIVFKDLHSESIIVSDKSVDSRKKLSIIETMKALKRIVAFEIKLP